jgi:hypothetical protein
MEVLNGRNESVNEYFRDFPYSLPQCRGIVISYPSQIMRLMCEYSPVFPSKIRNLISTLSK